MKLLHTLSVGLLFCLSAYSQVTALPAIDAEKFLYAIGSEATEDDLQELLAIVSYYSGKKDITVNTLETELATMPFLKEYAGAVAAKRSRLAISGVEPLGYGTPVGGGSGLFGTNATDLADGIAKFLIERSKQELSMAFFDRFKEDLKAYPELEVLFPTTSQLLTGLDNTNLQALLQEIKDAFSKDLLRMPDNLLALRNLDSATCGNNAACAARHAKIMAAFTSSATYDARTLILPLIVMQGIIDGDNIISITDRLVADPLVCNSTDDIAGSIMLSSILFQSLRSNDSDGGLFIKQDRLRSLFYNKDHLMVFLGLAYQQYSRLDCYKNITINNNNLEQVFTSILGRQVQFHAALSAFNQINVAYTSLKKAPDNQSGLALYTSVTSASLNALTQLVEATASATGVDPKAENYTKFLKNIGTAVDICNDVQQKNYPGLFAGIIKVIKDNNILPDSQEKLVRYLSFAANLASAKTSDEIKNAIETVALPPGSYSVKQKSSWNVALNGYLGYSADFNGGLYAHGFYAPVGFSFSKGLGSRHQWALTLFSSIIDVGGIVSYRIKDSESESLKQEIRLESIISPSAQLFVGIPKTPVALGVGWRMTPKLFFSGEGEFLAVPAKSAFTVSILVDIPIFTLFNKPYVE